MYIAVRDQILHAVGFKDVFEGLKWLGLDSFELALKRGFKTSIGFDLASRDGLTRLKEKLEAHGIKICAVLLENDFGKENLNEEIKYVSSAMRLSEELGVNVVRINSVMRPQKGWRTEDAVKATVKGVTESFKQSGSKVFLAIENHGVLGNDPGFIASILKRMRELNVGLTLDTGNFYWAGYPLSKVYEIYDMFAQYVKHTHIKNATVPVDRREDRRPPGRVRMTPLREGDINLKIAVSKLINAGYVGDLTIEDESFGQYNVERRREILLDDKRYLEEILSVF